MPVTPEDILHFCDNLDAEENLRCEATDRAITSRAYYSAYHVVLKIIDKLALPECENPKVRGSHQKQINRLIECPKARSEEFMKIRAVGYMASRTLNPHRTAADYKINEPFLDIYKKETVERSRHLLHTSQELLK